VSRIPWHTDDHGATVGEVAQVRSVWLELSTATRDPFVMRRRGRARITTIGRGGHMRRVTIDLGGVTAAAELWDERAPKTVAALLPHLPIADRTIHVRWSGAAWRTEKNYPLHVGEVENRATWLEPGDLIYYDDPRYDLYKVAFVYGTSQWRDDKGELYVARIGHVTENLDALIKASDEILFRGPRALAIRLAPSDSGAGGRGQGTIGGR